jgi:patatin-related protein
MSNQRSYYQPKFLREMQLGLVVYGDVSLAIYTHGICQEFYHAVRGRGIYKLVKALTDADLVVDAISGCSAGGINGILLAYAIANSNDREVVDYSRFAKIWRNSGDLLKLLQKPNLFKTQLANSANSPNFYQRGLLATLVEAIEHKSPRSPQEWFSSTNELDLAIAGTDYIGKVDRPLGENSVIFRAKNHRTTFRLKHRQGRKEPFNPYFNDPDLPRSPTDTFQALVKLCKITAGTPTIFPLVEVDLQDPQNLVDRQLVTWGKLSKQYSPDLPLDRGDKLYFLDGGLLDNAPLTCLMKEGYFRLPSRPGLRKLFYIDPNPDRLNDRLQVSKKPSRTGKILQAATLSIPIHHSITNDLRVIHEHNHKVRRYQASIDRAEEALESQQLLESNDRTQAQIYLRGRLFDFRDRNLPLLLHADLGSQNDRYSVVLDKIDRILTSKFPKSQDRHHHYKLLDRFESQIIDLDVEYSLRQHFYLIDRLGDLLNTDLEQITRDRLQCLSKQLSCNIKLLEVIKASIELLLNDRSVSNYFYYLIVQEGNDRRLRALVYELIFRLHRFLLNATKFQTFIPNDDSRLTLETIPVYFWLDLPELAAANDYLSDKCHQERWLSQTKISSIFAQFKYRIAEICQSTNLHPLIWADRELEYDNNRNQSFPSILKQISVAAEIKIEKLGDRYTDRLLKQWHTFEFIDRELYPFEYLTNLNEKEIINPICISPDNAQLGIGNGKSTQEKLGSDKLYNIGGFFKKSWRSNDLLWGRLDGLNQILEGIITPKSVTAFADFIQREADITNCSPSQYLDLLLTESLPNLSDREHRKIGQHLERLAQPGLRIDRLELQQILADLVLAGQQDILASDVHSAIEGMDEQPGWWRLPGDNRSMDEHWLLNKIDIGTSTPALPTSNPNTIVRIIQQSIANLAKQQQNFFRYQYRVGIDKLWENMPLVVLISLASKIVLLLRTLLVKVFMTSPRTQTIRHPLYHWLDGRLQAIYWWLQGGSIKLGAAHRRPRIILLQLLGAIATIAGIVLAFILSPLWLLFSLLSALACGFLQIMRLKRLTSVKGNTFLPHSRE